LPRGSWGNPAYQEAVAHMSESSVRRRWWQWRFSLRGGLARLL